MLANIDPVIDEILRGRSTDWVPVDRIISVSKDFALQEGRDFRAIASDVIAHLVKNEIMVPGVIGDAGFERWYGTADELVGRVAADCELLHWEPFGNGCWFANVENSDRVRQEAQR